MKKFFLLALLCCAAVVRADEIVANRFLMIVQASRDSRPQMTAVRTCVSNLFENRFTKQLHNGDTLGLWTFDDTLHAGNFPMQMWDGEEVEKISKRTDDFLKKQSSSREAKFAAVLPSLLRVVEDSEAITVLIFSDGFQPLQGTPFDTVINRVYLQHRETQRKIGAPFVTVLQARDGKFLHGAVSSAAAPLTLLPVPATPKPALAVAPAPVKKSAPPKILPSLILDYSKSNATPAPSPAPVSVVTPSAPGEITPATSPVPLVVPVVAPIVAVKPALVEPPALPKVEPKPVPVVAPTIAPAPVLAPAPAPVTAVMPAPGPKVELPRPPVSYPSARLEPAPVVATHAPAAASPLASVWPLMFGAGLIAGLIVAVAVWFFTRSQPAPRRSVITESLERSDKK